MPAEEHWTAASGPPGGAPRNRSHEEPTEAERELLRKAIRDAQPPAGRQVITWPEAFVLVAIFAAVVAIVAIIA